MILIAVSCAACLDRCVVCQDLLRPYFLPKIYPCARLSRREEKLLMAKNGHAQGQILGEKSDCFDQSSQNLGQNNQLQPGKKSDYIKVSEEKVL